MPSGAVLGITSDTTPVAVFAVTAGAACGIPSGAMFGIRSQAVFGISPVAVSGKPPGAVFGNVSPVHPRFHIRRQRDGRRLALQRMAKLVLQLFHFIRIRRDWRHNDSLNLSVAQPLRPFASRPLLHLGPQYLQRPLQMTLYRGHRHLQHSRQSPPAPDPPGSAARSPCAARQAMPQSSPAISPPAMGRFPVYRPALRPPVPSLPAPQNSLPHSPAAAAVFAVAWSIERCTVTRRSQCTTCSSDASDGNCSYSSEEHILRHLLGQRRVVNNTPRNAEHH